jgi:hypothetical protein
MYEMDKNLVLIYFRGDMECGSMVWINLAYDGGIVYPGTLSRSRLIEGANLFQESTIDTEVILVSLGI